MDHYKNALDRFAADTTPNEHELARYNRMVDAQLRGERPAQGVGWLTWGLGFGAMAAAAAALLALNSGALNSGALNSGPDPQAPLALSVDQADPVQVALTEHIDMTASGQGVVSGVASAPRYALGAGRVKFSVTPEQGIDLRVTTEDAEVRVLGTVFEVDKTALGTEVSVERGKVGVTCADGTPLTLTAGDSGLCLPGSAAGMLRRAQALEEGGDRHMQAIDLGLGMSPNPSIQAELLHLRMRGHLKAQDPTGALADAEALLAMGDAGRRADALNAAAMSTVSLTATATGSVEAGCEAAAPYFKQLEAEGVDIQADVAAACGR